MKVVLTIEDTVGGGVLITVDPGVPKLMQQAVAGNGTGAHAYALTAYRAIHDLAMREAVAGRPMETGEIPETKH